jgi:exodeoxyribonuclease V gamma subunit
MGMELRVASSLQILATELITDLGNEKPAVFSKQCVVTQTEGVNNWLKYELAQTVGIAANLQFLGINDILLLLYHWVCPDESTLIDKNNMTWAIFAELKEKEFCDRFPTISSYFANDEGHRAALAAEMADLFDQYQIYRHDKIAKWKKDENAEEGENSWQVYLWHKMKNRLKEGYSDRLDVSTRLLQKLKDPDAIQLIKNRLPSLRFFGIVIVTPYYLELFSTLSKIINVKFYLLNPCPEILWMDDLSNKKIAALRKRPDLLEKRNTGNELLINWGSIVKSSYSMMLAHEDYVNQYEVINDTTSEKLPSTLLRTIQYEIIHNLSESQRAKINKAMTTDQSLQLVGSFTPVREVEILYNYLLDEDPALRARDILIMVSDIDKYAPLVRAVFDNAPVSIPYNIADESVTEGNTIFTAIKDILSIDAALFKAEEVLSLLDSPFIRNRFGFTDTSVVRQAVREAGIYFGTIDRTGNPTYENTEAWMVSWDYGLEKIMYGLCISGEIEFNNGSHPLYPLDTAEGMAMADRTRLYHFIEVLKSILDERQQNRNLAEWAVYLGSIVREMIVDEEEENEDYPRFAALMETIAGSDQILQGETISYTTFRQIFFSKLEAEKRSRTFAGKGVGFCSLVPMRSVPYKIIGLLGMNFDSFPRQDSELSFSLIGKEPRPGDRSVRENDKHLFLETILAAKERLYISYLARDVRKGADMPPSTLVDELLDYIAQQTEEPVQFKKEKITIHPLHLFSTKYRNPHNKLPPNYLGNTLIEKSRFKKTEIAQTSTTRLTEVTVDHFCAFFKNPIKYYFNRQLSIYYHEEEEKIADTEIFELDTLQGWNIKDHLLKNNIEDTGVFIDRLKKAGKLPLANMGLVEAEQLFEEVAPYSTLLTDYKQGQPPRQLDILFEAEKLTIRGKVTLYGDQYIFCVLSSTALKWIMIPWIQYLLALAQAASGPLGFHFIYKAKSAPHTFSIAPGEISKQEASNHINALIDCFLAGQESYFPFYPVLGYAYFKKARNESTFLTLDRDKLYEDIEAEKDNANSNLFSDGGYIEKVINPKNTNTGLFGEASVKQLNENIKKLMSPIYDKCKEVFKKEK